MKSNKSSKSSSLSPNQGKLNSNNKSTNSSNKNNSIKTINEINKQDYLKEKTLKLILENKKNLSSILELERIIFKRFNNYYSNDKDFYYIKVINEIICNESTHIVAEFKDYLISGDYSEFLQKIYNLNECKECLPKIFEYYESCSVIFPNYVILPESKYIYKNIQRKQRVIDNQQDLEEKQEKIKKGLIKISEDNEAVFTSQALDSILDQTDTSNIRAFFGVKDSLDKNISLENIINKISTAENYCKTISDRKNTNCTLKKMNEKNKLAVTINLNNNNTKIKGRNYKRYLDGGYSSSSSNNNQKKITTGINVNSTISNGMKNTKVSSTTIEMDSKNFKNNINNNKDNNTIFISPNSKNLNIKNINVKKPNLVTKLLSYNNKEFIKRIFKEMNKKNQSNIQYKKPTKRNIKAFSPIEKSISNHKKSNSVKEYKKLLSSSSSSKGRKQITSFNSKKNFSKSKIGKIPQNSYHRSILSYNSKSKSKSKEKSDYLKPIKIKENNIPLTDRESKNSLNPEIMLILNSKINKIKNLNSNKKITMPLSSNKKIYNSLNTISTNSNVNNKQKNFKQLSKKLYFNRNKKSIMNGDSLLFTTNNYKNSHSRTKIKSGISSCFSLSPKKSPDYNKILKTINHFHSCSTFDFDDKNKNKKKIKNSVFPKKEIRRIEIKGFNNLIQNSNSNSRNNSNSERRIFNEALNNKMNRTNRNSNNFYSKTYLEIFKKKF